MIRVAVLTWFALWCGGTASAWVQDPGSSPEPPTTEVDVPLHDGRLEVDELLRALLDAYGIDAGEFDLPSASIEVRGIRGQIALFGCRKALLDTVTFRRDAEDRSLRIVIDRERARDLRRELSTRIVELAGRWSDEELLGRRYALETPTPCDADRPLVVLVHGVESGPGAWSDLRASLADGGFQFATFAYPNDGPCDLAAAQLAAELRELSPQRVQIVAHSMGGLIARAAIEDPELDPGNVDSLILIGTPNQGSDLASLRFAVEAAQVLAGSGGAEDVGTALLAGVQRSLLDGLGEAGEDLAPGSVFLTRLNARPRNERVTYHSVLGTRSLLSREQYVELRDRAVKLLAASRGTRLVRPGVERFVAELPELIDGEGDGAVSVERGRLDGVEAVLVRLDHVGLIRVRGLSSSTNDADAHPVFELVREWLAASEAPSGK